MSVKYLKCGVVYEGRNYGANGVDNAYTKSVAPIMNSWAMMDGDYFDIEVYNVRAMDTHKIVGQSLFHFFHRKQGDNRFRLAFNPHLKIFAHSLYISDVRDIDFDDTIVGFEE